MNFGHFSNFCIILFSTLSCHLISHSISHLTPLTLSPPHGRPSGMEGDTSCFPFYTKPPPFYTIPTSFTNSKTHINKSFAFHFIFSSLLQRSCLHQSSPKSPFSSTQTLASRNPNPSTSNFKNSSRASQGLPLQPPTSKATQGGASPSQASTTTHGLKPPSSSWVKLQLNPSM